MIRLLPESATRDARLLLCSRGVRAFADGFVSILLPAYLLARGFDPFEIGVLATATMLGSAALTLAIGFIATRVRRKHLLNALSLLMIATGFGFAFADGFWPLLVVALVGTLNPSAGDVSAFLPLEHAILSQTIADRDRTALFARFSLVGALTGAFGTLSVGAIDLLDGPADTATSASLLAFQAMFLLYALLGAVVLIIYRRLTIGGTGEAHHATPLGPSRGIVLRLAALFSIDSFAGGFTVQSMLALWLFQRFDLAVADAAQIFFATSLLAAVSYLLAVPLARRIGLVNTMVFTHLPANLCLVAVPFMSDLRIAIALLLVRGLLSQMDVAPRNSYVMAMVTPAERTAAASLTAVPRSLAGAASPGLAGWLLNVSPFGWPILIGGSLKIVYDLALLALFRSHPPPEERKAP